MLEEHYGSFAGFDVRHMRAENLYALHLMLNHEKLRDMNFGRDKPGDTIVLKTNYELNLSDDQVTPSPRKLMRFDISTAPDPLWRTAVGLRA